MAASQLDASAHTERAYGKLTGVHAKLTTIGGRATPMTIGGRGKLTTLGPGA